jgi:hypothetical protein
MPQEALAAGALEEDELLPDDPDEDELSDLLLLEDSLFAESPLLPDSLLPDSALPDSLLADSLATPPPLARLSVR